MPGSPTSPHTGGIIYFPPHAGADFFYPTFRSGNIEKTPLIDQNYRAWRFSSTSPRRAITVDMIPPGGIFENRQLTLVAAAKGRQTVSDSPAECAHAVEKRVEQPHKTSLRRRVNRVAGQIQGVGKMIEEDRYCVDILVQISAVRSALNQVAMQIVEDHTRGCVRRAIQADEGDEGDEAIAELMDVLKKFTR